MTIPPQLQQELKKIAGLAHAAEIQEAVEGHVNLATAKSQGQPGEMTNLFNSIMIADENLQDAEKLARVYAKSLSFLGLIEEDKVEVLDWQTVFRGTTKTDGYTAMAANVDAAFKKAEGGVLIISEPYQCPPEMTPRDFVFNNYTATAHLMEKMDEMDCSFDKTFDDLYDKGNNLSEIEKQMNGQDFENPRKPVVIVIGKPFEMKSMMSEDPHPWNMRFMHKVGLGSDTGRIPAAAVKKPGAKNTAPGV